MASNPPLNVMEDQTDEDFFDKLVDDDFGPAYSVGTATKFGDGGSDSDEAKAFANMSIEDTSGEGGGPEGMAEKETVDESAGLFNVHTGEVLGSVSVIEPRGSDGVHREVVSDSVASKPSGVKEVGWSSFHTDMVPNGNYGFGSYSDFFNDSGDNLEDFYGRVDGGANVGASANPENVTAIGLKESVSYEKYGDDSQFYGGSELEGANGQDLNSSQYWENMFPGWKYDSNTGQWYQVDSFDISASVQGNCDGNHAENEWAAVSDGKMETNYLTHTSQPVGETVAKTITTESVSSWNQVSQGNNNGYPEHMVFDPQYPGWYYDMVALEWRSLESYTTSIQSKAIPSQEQQSQSGMAFGGQYSQYGNGVYNEYGQSAKFGSLEHSQHSSWGDSYSSSYNQQASSMWQPETVAKTDAAANFGGSQQFANPFFSNASSNNHLDHWKPVNSLGRVLSYENASQGHVEANGFVSSQGFVSGRTFGHQINQLNLNQNAQMSFSNDYGGVQKPATTAQQPVQANQQFSHASNVGRSSAGRPPHALVAFGFGGKLIVMKDSTSLGELSFGTQDPVGGTISVLNLMEVVFGSTTSSLGIGGGSCSYFHALCQQSFPGPLVGGSIGNKELNKWIDERISNCGSPDMDYRKGEALKLLLSLLKIACQHYGKLRSPFGSDASSRENESPESAVAKLFASVKMNASQMNSYGAAGQCLQNLPSDGQIRATASEVQNLLVSGRKKEALLCAQEGQLWGPALVLASQLSDQFYVDTVKQMALRQLIAGSPLRTLCLLIAGQPAEVFSTGTSSNGSFPGALNVAQQPVQSGTNVMLDDWEENLAVITANRTNDDELVILHLGDCLWKDRSEIIGAHICYLVAEANFEPYSDSARLCLIAADHWKHPRTYASPEAIQRTELFEYSKVLGNSQFILLSFQPYKLIYAYMLAEVGKVSDSLKYCQAVLKSLKTVRVPEVETWKELVSSLGERLRTHQQGGYATNLAPAKLVGKLLKIFDGTAHRVVGGLPPPVPSTSQGGSQNNEHWQTAPVHRVSASQSTMAMSSLMPSASMEPISEWAADGNRMSMHNRSVSEPDFGRTPRQVDSPKEGTSSSAQGKTSSSGSSRLGRFGFGSQLFQKTMGLVLRPRSDKQAKLGERNKFYYDEKLKRWVEEGAELPPEKAALPPPPTTSAFQNGTNDYNLKAALKNDETPTNGSPTFKSPSPTEHMSGMPPIPTSSNQFSTRGRMCVRARYVDTFNQGGGTSANLFHSPPVPSVKPAIAAPAKFFIPSPLPSSDHSMEAMADNTQDDITTAENSLTSAANDSSRSPLSSSSATMQTIPSMDNITRKGATNESNVPIPSHSRRTASWSGSFSGSFPPPGTEETKLPGEALGIPPSLFLPSVPAKTPMPESSNNFGDELHEVEL